MVRAAMLGVVLLGSWTSAADELTSALREGSSATFFAVVSASATVDTRAATRWATLGADDASPLEGLRHERLWRSADCVVAIPAALLLWREATAREVPEARAAAMRALERCGADEVWRPTAVTVANVDWHWLMEVGLEHHALDRVSGALADEPSWTWSFAWVALGEVAAPRGASHDTARQVKVFDALSRGRWADVLDALKTPFIDEEVDAVLRAIALDALGRRDEAIVAAGGHFSGRLVAGHPLLYVLQSAAFSLRGGRHSDSLGSFCRLDEHHAVRAWAASRAPRATCGGVVGRVAWESPLW